MIIYYLKERNAGTKPMKLGARILKTGIAIVLALYLATWLGLPTPVFAGIAAVFAIQPSIYRSFLTIVDQVQANIIGAKTCHYVRPAFWYWTSHYRFNRRHGHCH